MIRINGMPVSLGSFPDGTMLLKQEIPEAERITISWFFENDRETPALLYLANHLRAHGKEDLHLYMPYIPNARQDRVKNSEDVFTLKYFAELLNSLHFKTVTVLDPHSAVSEALIQNVIVQTPQGFIEKAIRRIQETEGELPSMFYPDEGAGKRYAGMISLPYAFGMKNRDWRSGRILELDAAGDVACIAEKNVLIVDDICSKGGTFFFSAQKLKELGAKNLYLYITHCENTIHEGELLRCGLFEKIFTTSSILTKPHEKIEVFPL